MKVSYAWLKKIVQFDFSPEELADKLTELGLEVDSITPIGQKLDGIVVARIMKVSVLNTAKSLSLCTVDAGNKTYNVVCGAQNVKKNMKTALAIPGAMLPDGRVIALTDIAGVCSEGMLCSAKELGISEDESGIVVLDPSVAVGTSLSSIDDIADWIIEIELTPNRPDCLSVRGVAREIAVAVGLPIMMKQRCGIEDKLLLEESLDITIDDSSLCENYSAYIIRGVTVGPSPFWLSHRLEILGIRSINTIVDIANYVMMEMGHPLHAFDLDKLEGAQINVRCARFGEKMITLDGQERILDESMLVIADKSKPIAIAGVMGGESSVVDDKTTNILLEGAYFNPVSIRKTAKKLGLSSESSYRFERGTDRLGFQEALQRAAYMIAGIGNAKSRSVLLENNSKPYRQVNITCDLERVRSLIGVQIANDRIQDILKSLNIQILSLKKNIITLQPPSYRVDLKIEEDIVEEVARIYGYNAIPLAKPGSKFIEYDINKKYNYARLTRNILIGSGFFETVTCSLHPSSITNKIPSFFNPQGTTAIAVANPLSEMHQILQTSLVPNMLTVIENNIRQKCESVKLFEIGTIFIPDETHFSLEKTILSLAISSKQSISFTPNSNIVNDSFFVFKGILEDYFEFIGIKNTKFQKTALSFLHSGKSASITLNDTKIGYMGQVHPEIVQERSLYKETFLAELDADVLISHMNPYRHYHHLPKYPAVDRDLAIVIDNTTPFQQIYDSVMNSVPGLLETFNVVSIYEGAPIPQGKKSLSLRMRYRAREKTLNDQEVDAIHDKLARIVVNDLKCDLR